MIRYRSKSLNVLMVVPVVAGMTLAQTSAVHADRAGNMIGAGAAGVALGLILGGMANQSQSAPQQQQQQQRPRASSGTRTPSAPAMSKADIEKIQESLNLLGFDPGSIDGAFGGQTIAAIKKFQVSKGFSQTGRLSPAEQSILLADVDKMKTAALSAGVTRSLTPPATQTSLLPPVVEPPKEVAKEAAPDPKLEIAHWESVRTSKFPEEIQDYIEQYPQGRYKKLAELRIEQLKREAAPSVLPPVAPPVVASTDGTAPTTFPAIDDSRFPKARQRRPDAVAVIVGNSTYSNEIPKVDFSHRDAEAIKLLAMKTLGIESQNVIFLKDATRATLERTFGTERDYKGDVWRRIDPDGGSELFVFYSGHGVPSPDEKTGASLLPVDADPKMASYNGYPLDLLYKNLGELKTKNTTVFLDACFSGRSPDANNTPLIKNASPVYITKATPGDGSKINVFAAANERQVSSWDTNEGYGLFTRYVLLGLSGEASEAKRKDITAKELSDYVGKNVRRAARRLHGREQEPQFSGDGTLIISSF